MTDLTIWSRHIFITRESTNPALAEAKDGVCVHAVIQRLIKSPEHYAPGFPAVYLFDIYLPLRGDVPDSVFYKKIISSSGWKIQDIAALPCNG